MAVEVAMTTRTESMQQWERAEIARSSVEATLTADQALRVSERTFARYASPPGDTAYPLEYAYHELGRVDGQRIVDFGCGSGANSVLLANRGAHVWGIDISEDLLRLAKAAPPSSPDPPTTCRFPTTRSTWYSGLPSSITSISISCPVKSAAC
jgi:2-polyprenyl-3-methyl-5-hydroxy-6-metoxy-1,4-benzoquinol methylase